jgi:hypothetical protein
VASRARQRAGAFHEALTMGPVLRLHRTARRLTPADALRDASFSGARKHPLHFAFAMTAVLDAELMRRAALGERAAVAALYDRHSAVLLGVALRVVGARADAEDVLHDMFVSLPQRARYYVRPARTRFFRRGDRDGMLAA